MTTLSPLDCATCSKELHEPIYLDCSHLFCKDCISGRSDCPTCGKSIPADFSFDVDPLTSFLIDTSHEAAETCANCERISQPMFFCETCQQSLCVGCKTETHEARMFARHRVVPLEERARVRGATTCISHPAQPYVLWCSETKKLVCIDCFKGRVIESGHSFIAIDQAHRAQLEKLEQWAERLHAFQEERREEAAARERLIAEINENAKATRNDIWSVCQQVVDTVVGVREKLTRQLEEERRKKEDECRKEIAVCTRAVSSGSYCLLSTHILCSAASFIDFLQLNGELVKRIQSHLSTPAPSPPPGCSSTINTRSELAKALEGVLGLSRPAERGGRRKEHSGGYKGRSGSPVSVLSKYQMIVDLAGAFGGLMVQVEGPLREVNAEVARLTRAVQERQRDITMRKLLLRKEEIEGTVQSLESVRDRVRSLIDRQKALRPEAQAMWEEELDRVTRQQAIFRRKMEDAASLEEQADRALTVSHMLLPFAEGIEKMTEILDRKRLHPPDPAPMESICIQINTLSPDSRLRVQAIEKEEQLRLAREVRRKEEEDESTKQKTVQSLKHTKRRENRKSSHRIVDDRRERSPGGTDVALLSPFHRHTNSITSEDSEVESVSIGVDLLFESDRERSTRWRHETTGTVTTEDDEDATSAAVTEERQSAVFRVNMRTEAQVAERQQNALNVAARRHTVLSSLNRAIVDYGGGEGNLKASEVKRAERSRANTGDPLDYERPLSAPLLFPPMSISIDERRATVAGESDGNVVSVEPVSASMTSLFSPPHGVVPAVPFVPQEVFQRANSAASPDCGMKMGAFEMRERMLESLKGRVTRYEDEEEEKEGASMRL
ncbi:hypothetical protein PMAYCL1PPCAC_30365 [Pristionchus mayeri]|uniref:RING finger protein 207 n=1 Tax=Pristionchus mayeri TaxID=1317129 RepID=A0AAN5DCI8_9BILA|nr:hypothetical protein PMAYCL1PPCAC_30365 [Pristionchus mayeri]